MKRILMALSGLMLCAAPLHSNAADPALPPQGKMGEERSAAITDVPETIDMSHADPKTWHSLRPEVQVYGQVLAQELQLPTHSSADRVHSEDTFIAIAQHRTRFKAGLREVSGG
jgi:hypothetical protein